MSPVGVDLPASVHACVIARLPFKDRCRVASVCKAWQALVGSAAAHEYLPEDGGSSHEWVAGDLDVDMRLVAEDEDDPYFRLACCEACPATRFASSAGILLGPSGIKLLRSLKRLKHLALLDVTPYAGQNALCHEQAAPILSLTHLRSLTSLHVVTSLPLVHLSALPSSLQQLKLEWFVGASKQQLHTTCSQLAAAAPQLPLLRRLELSAELEQLLSKDSPATTSGLNQLSALTQLTSVRVTRFQQPTPISAGSPCQQGYTRVPAFLAHLPQLRATEVHLCSGHNADVQLLQNAGAVCLHLTLEREEPTPFNRLPSSLTLLTGLTELVVTLAEFQSQRSHSAGPASSSSSSGSGTANRHSSSSSFASKARRIPPVFDVTPLKHCRSLRRLLLELHGMPGRLHDVQGLEQLASVHELVLLLKCPALSSLRKLLLGLWPPGVTAAAASLEELEAAWGASSSAASATTRACQGRAGKAKQGGAGASVADDGSCSSGSSGSSSGRRRGLLAQLLSCFRTSGSSSHHYTTTTGVQAAAAASTAQRALLMRASDGGASSISSSDSTTCTAKAAGLAAVGWPGAGVGGGPQDVALCRDIMACLGGFAPVFAAGVPPAVQKVLVATTCRLLLQQPQDLLQAQEVGLLASQLYLQGAGPATAAAAPWAGSTLAGVAPHALGSSGSGSSRLGSAAAAAMPGQQGGSVTSSAAAYAPVLDQLAEQVAQQGTVAQRHLQLLQGAVAQVQAAGGRSAGAKLAMSPTVAPHWHAVRYNQQHHAGFHHAMQLEYSWQTGCSGRYFAGGGVLLESAAVSNWFAQRSAGRLLMHSPAVHPQMVASPAPQPAVAAGGPPGALGVASPASRPWWVEVDEEGDLVGPDVAPLVTAVTCAGVSGWQLVEQLVEVVERDCFTYFC